MPLNSPSLVSKRRLWIGRVLSALPVLVLLASAAAKLVRPPGFDEGLAHLGWTINLALGLAILEITCTVIYIIPRTAVLGAILLTAYLGGATATHVRVGDPYFLQPLLGVLVWAGLYLRDPRLHALLPLKKDQPA
jgi:hypothetical protein